MTHAGCASNFKPIRFGLESLFAIQDKRAGLIGIGQMLRTLHDDRDTDGLGLADGPKEVLKNNKNR
jgi:hypothetical protein